MRESILQVMDSLNILGGEAKAKEAVVDAFRRSHRTMQQSFMRVVIIPILVHLAEHYKSGNLDGRNMESGRLASRMLENLTDDDLYLPFI